jgi:magnesium transporter
MIDVLIKNEQSFISRNINELSNNQPEIICLHLVNLSEADLKYLAKLYQLDIRPVLKGDDIEISSRFIESVQQISLNITLPYLDSEQKILEAPAHLMLKNNVLYSILESQSEKAIVNYFTNKPIDTEKYKNGEDILILFFEMLTDYYADLIELITKRVRKYSEKIIGVKSISEKELDNLTEINFANIQIKECVIELQKIVLLLRKSNAIDSDNKQRLALEFNDLAVINEYIQYNFDRLDDLKENISSKIDLEQNKIMKTFTVITVCIAPPTLIAGIYGMNFEKLPELKWMYGYPFALCLMLTTVIIILTFFKIKKWI